MIFPECDRMVARRLLPRPPSRDDHRPSLSPSTTNWFMAHPFLARTNDPVVSGVVQVFYHPKRHIVIVVVTRDPPPPLPRPNHCVLPSILLVRFDAGLFSSTNTIGPCSRHLWAERTTHPAQITLLLRTGGAERSVPWFGNSLCHVFTPVHRGHNRFDWITRCLSTVSITASDGTCRIAFFQHLPYSNCSMTTIPTRTLSFVLGHRL